MNPGTRHTLIVKQDEIGSRILLFDTAYIFPGGTAPTVTATAGAVDVLEFFCDGEVLYLTGITQAVA